MITMYHSKLLADNVLFKLSRPKTKKRRTEKICHADNVMSINQPIMYSAQIPSSCGYFNKTRASLNFDMIRVKILSIQFNDDSNPNLSCLICVFIRPGQQEVKTRKTSVYRCGLTSYNIPSYSKPKTDIKEDPEENLSPTEQVSTLVLLGLIGLSNVTNSEYDAN